MTQGSSTPDPAPPERPDLRDPGGSGAAQLWWYRDVREPAPPPPPSLLQTLRARLRVLREQHAVDALACLGLSTLWFSRARTEALFSNWGFYNKVPLGAPVIWALLLNIVGLAAVGVLAIRAIRQLRRRAWRRLAALVAAATVLTALNFARITHEFVDRWTDAIGGSGLAAIAVVTLAVSFGWPDQALRVLRGVGLLASPVAVLTVAHALWMFVEVGAGPVWRRAELAPLGKTPPSLRRVVWVVLGELDQRITFEARPAGLELPELDRLRRESLSADAARPPAGTADISMPALILGRPVVAVAPSNPNDLELTFKEGPAALWSAQPNVFSSARAIGYDTAVIGWGLPYPRVLGTSLGAADWRPSAAREQARADTFSLSLVNQWASLAPPANARRLTSERVAELRDLAVRTAADARFGLVLLHLPVPGPPGVYDRATGSITAWNFSGPGAEYLDNLALADQVIAELRRRLERSRLDDRTWLILSGDRWWQGSTRYDGHVDHRVPFLVRPPEGGRETHVDAAFSTLATHDLVLAILRGSIRDTSDAVDWLSRNPMAPPRGYTGEGRPVY